MEKITMVLTKNTPMDPQTKKSVKEKDLNGIEQLLHMLHTCFTGRNHR
jgi:hypothetical protein